MLEYHIRDTQRIGAARVLARALADTVEPGHVAQEDLLEVVTDLAATLSVLEQPDELAWMSGFIINRLAHGLFDQLTAAHVDERISAFESVDGVRTLLDAHRLPGGDADQVVARLVADGHAADRGLLFAASLLVLSETVNDVVDGDPIDRRAAIEGLMDAILSEFTRSTV